MIKLFSGQFCSRCHMISPLLKKYAEENGLDYIEKDISEATPEETEGCTMLPIIIWDGEKIEYDEALARIM